MGDSNVVGARRAAVCGCVSGVGFGPSAVESGASACALITETYAGDPGEPEG
ncbi:hypothetical protein G3A49_16045 [Haloferax volcanii]|uniref:Uncharacterized protein n=1 Tax=Haloferax volcanii TaxID=2246 RepID=A0A6C0UVK2_HALVO|nr:MULTISPECIES: hypothetical protein [Haloferax]NLV04136.1 hypothetical protein [Haloferax alexandrinus]QIB79532.1 hypothetical protein G3A49_16045 [Haloferax alexandrinus]